MLWRVQADQRNFRIIVSDGSPYPARDFVGIEPIHPYIDENALRYALEDDRDVPVGDFLGGQSPVLVFQPQLLELFQMIRQPKFATYQALCDGLPVCFYCCLEERPGFDFDRSIFRRFEGSENIQRIFDLRLKRGFSQISICFACPTIGGAASS